MKKIFRYVLAGLILLSACGAQGGMDIHDAWARASTQGMNSAVYFVIENNNAEADELIGAGSNVADAVEIHESKMEGDMMMMNHVESIALAASAKVEFMPGGYHIMLIGLKQDLKAGDEIEVTLQFRNGPDITIKATIKNADGM